MSARCRACGADVYFAATVNGKAMPLDPNPTDEGNVELTRPDYARPPVAVVLKAAELAVARAAGDRPLYVSHFATCPKADRFRRPKAKPAGAALPANVLPFPEGGRR